MVCVDDRRETRCATLTRRLMHVSKKSHLSVTTGRAPVGSRDPLSLVPGLPCRTDGVEVARLDGNPCSDPTSDLASRWLPRPSPADVRAANVREMRTGEAALSWRAQEQARATLGDCKVLDQVLWGQPPCPPPPSRRFECVGGKGRGTAMKLAPLSMY